MKDKLKDYIDQVFADAPNNQRTREVKEELYSNISDRYDDLIREGKSETAAYNISIEGIGDISELIEDLKVGESSHGWQDSSSKPIIWDPEQRYNKDEQKLVDRYQTLSGILNAVAVALYILCWVPLVVLTEIFPGNASGIIGIVIMMVMIAVATGIFIVKPAFKPACMRKHNRNDKDDQEEKKDRNKGKNPILAVLHTILWILAFVAYFSISFATGAWNITWMLFIIAAALDGILEAIFDLAASKRSRVGNIVKLVIWAIVATILIPIFTAGIVADGVDWNFSLGNFTVLGGEYYVDEDSYQVGNSSYTENVKDIELFWASGKVSFTVWDGDHVLIEETGAGNDTDHHMRTKVENGRLIIRYAGSGVKFLKSYPEKELTVRLPKTIASNLGNIEINTASANVDISGLYLENLVDSNHKNGFGVDSLTVNTASGDLSVDGLIANEIEVHTATGKVFLNGDYEDVNVDSVSGKVEIWGNSNELEVGTVSGNIMIYRFATSGEYKTDLNTVSGTVEISANALSHLDVETVSGNVFVDMKDNGDGFVARLDSVSGRMTCNGSAGDQYYFGNGKGYFNFETVSGRVTINVRE